MEYYKLTNNHLTKVESVERINGAWVSNPSAEDCAKIEAYPRNEESFIPPPCGEGYHTVADGYEVVEGKWVMKWRVEPITYTVDDYDAAMEEYLRQVRTERGYTTREPDDYFGSSNPRWAQDAKDWVAFRDAVMTYALNIINEYAATGVAPSLKDFKAGFPVITWTFTEESE